MMDTEQQQGGAQASPFDASAWLAQFVAAGGWYAATTGGTKLGLSIWGYNKREQAAVSAMAAALSPAQREAVEAAIVAQALAGAA